MVLTFKRNCAPEFIDQTIYRLEVKTEPLDELFYGNFDPNELTNSGSIYDAIDLDLRWS